jgi:hypothetical protein
LRARWRLIEHLRRQGDGAIRIVGVFDDEARGASREVAGLPVLGTVTDLVTVARRRPLDQVIIALPWEAETRLPAWMKQLQSLPVEVSFCPHLAGTTLARARIAPVAGLPMLSIQAKPLAGWSYIVKSMEDRVLAAIILVVIAPLLALIALAIKLDSRGPVLFRQKRYGLDNQVIEVLKFRTLRCEHCDDAQVMPVSRNDPRVTRIGRLLRRTSLDELPQFFNVLAGTMSIVGAAPCRGPRGALCAPDRGLPRAPPGQARDHRLGPGQRPAGRDRQPRSDGAAGPPRPLLHRELVAAARSQDHPAHRARRFSRQLRLLSVVGGSGRGRGWRFTPPPCLDRETTREPSER